MYKTDPFMKLIGSLKNLKGYKIEIETKQNVKIEGIFVSIDQTMNITMKDTKIWRGAQMEDIGEYVIRGTSIRYISWEGNLDLKERKIKLGNKNIIADEK
ncbi:hypothetical protein TCON_0998 [Astathelohania contejeani]|uniref:Sm domain-containing protein n=1 Tax=Astathelohania contejeani TaxID=164912 RepID=A0ABQ7I044_9MICR|nr:hypothetical protein TCON_0998 [Thelohania contejeani]